MFENLDLRSSSTLILLIPLAFIVGAIASEPLAFAAKQTMGQPFLEIWDAMPKIYTIKNTEPVDANVFFNRQLSCKPGYVIIGTSVDTAEIPLFTTHIDTIVQKFSVFGSNAGKPEQEFHMTLSCLGV